MTKPSTRVLIVDADEETRTFLRRRLEGVGYEVLEAGDPARTLSLIATVPFDLMLLDLRTACGEGRGGLDLLRLIRDSRSRAELPILALAPELGHEDVVEALELGADDGLVRPLQLDVVSQRIEMLAARRAGSRPAPRLDLVVRLDTLGEAASRSEAISARLLDLGQDMRSPLTTLVSAANTLTSICRTPELAPEIAALDAAVEALDVIIARALGHADRRRREPKAKLNVLLVDHDTESREGIYRLLDAAQPTIELTPAATGLAASLAAETRFFDLIVINTAAPEATAGIRAIRRAERNNRTRRTPLLATGARREASAEALLAGADLYLQAPITPDRLLVTLADAIWRESQEMCAVA